MIQQRIDHWKENVQDEALRQDLESLQKGDEAVLRDCFYRNLAFGTGGMRGELGVGPNRLNIYTVRKAALGLAHYLTNNNQYGGKVVIAYDSRHQSQEFANQCALTLIENGYKALVFKELKPTPMLSFAVRHTKAVAGIMITASHNPPEYNGVKVYNEQGAQLPLAQSDELISYVNAVEDELTIAVADYTEAINNHQFTFVPEDVDDAYQEALTSIVQDQEQVKAHGADLSIVFSPLHGTAREPLRRALTENGFTNVTLVSEQEHPDPQFSTVKLPNPEDPAAFTLVMKKGNEMGADVLIATDPDADRIGVAVPDENSAAGYRLLNGNETGLLLLHQMLQKKSEGAGVTNNDHVLKTIVTSESGRVIAEHFGASCVDTLTGFKFIAEKIEEFSSDDREFLFGYEESYGYLLGSFVRDKDAIQAGMIICEAALLAKENGETLLDQLHHIYDQFGYFKEQTNSMELKGERGAKQIEQLIQSLRKEPFEAINGIAVKTIEDYQLQERVEVTTNAKVTLHLPKSNVIKYFLSDETWICVRPSGTEPKLKVYFGVRSETSEGAHERLADVSENVMNELTNRL
ncbi:phospho-sugar mutase [Geomicrobium sp. JCM 19055]|uniref:phospho-sugar mutase n=1 Tax=Geomicrobium sp. JCM 19055 TaxID=1460649 RepID=UPI00045ED37C|nr:phospho-sugar mutase [Geomicrobium sp. JCM 19055]GAK01628.1 phosphomannomutase [Geomicrobium sp. JCM 19055]